MNQIDTAGTYRGEITEHGLGVTKNGYPQFIGRFLAHEKYVEDPQELQHFVSEGAIEDEKPQWVDWSEYNEGITGFLVLFNDAESFDENSKLLSYDQLQLAVGWDGTEFDSLNNDVYVGSNVLFRVEENEYNGQVRLQVNWVDAYDANPARELSKLDDERVKSLASKLKVGGSKKPSKAKGKSKGQGKGKKAGETQTGKTKKGSGQSSAKSTTKPTSKPPQSSPPKQSDAQDAGSESETPEEGAATAGSELPTAVSQLDAWEFVCQHKGENADSDIETAWVNAASEVGPDMDEEDFTEEDWAAVRDKVIEALSLDIGE